MNHGAIAGALDFFKKVFLFQPKNMNYLLFYRIWDFLSKKKCYCYFFNNKDVSFRIEIKMDCKKNNP